jgi:hypothetical protein
VAMKKNTYSCKKCGESIQTVDRDKGKTPIHISCENEKCDGMMSTSFYKVDQEADFEFVFISPRNNKEWQVIEKQVTEDVEKTFPEQSRLDRKKMRDNFITMLREHVRKGHLIHLQKSLVTLP